MTKLALGFLPVDRARWPLAALLASGAMLATAHAFERFLLLAPCPLCYNQRQVYWAAGALALVGVILAWRGAKGGVSARVQSAICLLLGVVFLAGAGVAGYHSLVEWGVLPAPATCAVGNIDIGAPGDLWERLGKPLAVPSCAEAQWWFLGLSMAAWNTLVSLGLAALSLWAAFRPLGGDTANETPADILASRSASR